MVVSGDVFDSNQVDRRTLARALEALQAFPVPVYLLAGNHDPLDASSVFRSRAFVQGCPEHVHVLQSGTPVEAPGGIEVVGAPWFSKRPLTDLASAACEELPPGPVRVLVAHGRMDTLSPDRADPALIRLEAIEAALGEGRIHYVALGDRHSVTRVGETGRIWYSGASEPTRFDEVRPAHALVVELSGDGIDVTPHPVGRWRFVRREFDLDTDEDLARLDLDLGEVENKPHVVLELRLRGTLTLCLRARLDELLDGFRDVFAGVETREADLAVVPDDSDFTDVNLSGFALDTVSDLRQQAAGGNEAADTARGALALLIRLTGGSA